MLRPIIALAASVVMASAVIAQPTPTPTLTGTVYQTTNLRSAPTTQSEIIGRLAEGEQVIGFARTPDARWLRVETEDSSTGWLPIFALMIVGDVQALPIAEDDDPLLDGAVIAFAVGRVNVRSGPSVEFDVVGQLDVAEQVSVNARSSANNDWLHIERGVLRGWVAYFTVRVQGDPDTLPILTVDRSAQIVPPTALVRARFNTRLHTEPLLDSPTISIVPFDAEVTVIARSSDGTWLYVRYDSILGWGAAELFDLDAGIRTQVPQYAAPTATPTAAA